jgi:uncharacterized ion transporter superfamily protein YfcC
MKFNDRTVVVAKSQHTTLPGPQNFWNLMECPFLGFIEAACINAFALLVEDAFGLVMTTGAIDVGLRN